MRFNDFIALKLLPFRQHPNFQIIGSDNRLGAAGAVALAPALATITNLQRLHLECATFKRMISRSLARSQMLHTLRHPIARKNLFTQTKNHLNRAPPPPPPPPPSPPHPPLASTTRKYTRARGLGGAWVCIGARASMNTAKAQIHSRTHAHARIRARTHPPRTNQHRHTHLTLPHLVYWISVFLLIKRSM